MSRRVVSPDLRARLYELRHVEDLSLQEIYDRFPKINPNTIRTNIYREKRNRNETQPEDEAPEPDITTARPEITEEVEEQIWNRAKRLSDRRAQQEVDKERRSIEFDHGPVGIVFMADLHLGSHGVDYRMLDEDLDTIMSTPGVHIVTVGDFLDNFIIGYLKSEMGGKAITIPEQWVMAKMVLKRIAPRHVAAIAGNHDLWTYLLTHVDYFNDILSDVNPQIIYDQYDARIDIQVGMHAHSLRARHSWKGSSIYNDTHGIERASKFDKGREFDIGVAAHDHKASLVREFNNGGDVGLAIKCGSYKVYDQYAEKIGASQSNVDSNQHPAPIVILESDGSRWGTSSFRAGCRYLQAVYGS